MQSVINELVRRYVMMNLRRDNDEGVTRMTSRWRHDDVTVTTSRRGSHEDDVITSWTSWWRHDADDDVTVTTSRRGSHEEDVTMTSWWRHDDVMTPTMTSRSRRHDEGVTEDDVIEIKHDISALRYELLDVFRTNGMKLPSIHPTRQTSKRRATACSL